ATLSLAVAAEETALRDHVLCYIGAVVIYCYPPELPYLACNGQLVETLAKLAKYAEAAYLIGTANEVANDLMPRIAGKFGSAFVGNCVGLGGSSSQLRFLRPTFGGSVVAECETASKLVVITVEPTRFACAKPAHDACRLHTVCAATSFDDLVQCIERRPNAAMRPPLETARVVVAGGRPIGARFYELLEPIADELGAALGATRSLCDTGFVAGELQVGLTGKVITPDLYVAIGISGSTQHLSGIRNAKAIVAINSDEHAPIFAFAKYGLVGDLWNLVPELLTTIRRIRGEPSKGSLA
ncbi:MAG TPA: electron transfer flavoprotein subunit alpha/FixB family protein, partial [Polyangiaceae bacterium]